MPTTTNRQFRSNSRRETRFPGLLRLRRSERNTPVWKKLSSLYRVLVKRLKPSDLKVSTFLESVVEPSGVD